MPEPVISVTELAALRQNGTELVLADCRFELSSPEAGYNAYQQSHLPGAHFLNLSKDLSGAKGSTGGRHPIPTEEHFSGVMQGIGLNQDTLLVAYDDGSHAGAARLWWLARYFGHDRVSVLNGGLAAWTRAGLPTDTEAPLAQSGSFKAAAKPAMRLDFEQVTTASPAPLLVDARDRGRYSGAVEPIDPLAGHIPGALNMPWQTAMDAQGLLLDAQGQRQRWQHLLNNERPLVNYCGSGVTACVNLLSMELAGINNALLYPGSWSDWCQRGGEAATESQ
jgi:thiosulfate/3-mercaptopyruvate sulfurtransferase